MTGFRKRVEAMEARDPPEKLRVMGRKRILGFLVEGLNFADIGRRHPEIVPKKVGIRWSSVGCRARAQRLSMICSALILRPARPANGNGTFPGLPPKSRPSQPILVLLRSSRFTKTG